MEKKTLRRLHDTSQFERQQLSNGITVWLQKPSIVTDYKGYLSIFFKNAGSASEKEGSEGLAHFLEHMLFRRSLCCNSESELVAPITENGGIYNGRTNVN